MVQPRLGLRLVGAFRRCLPRNTGSSHAELKRPDPLEFITSDAYLRRRIYPRQGTLLKLIFARTDLLTSYDFDVIGGNGPAL